MFEALSMAGLGCLPRDPSQGSVEEGRQSWAALAHGQPWHKGSLQLSQGSVGSSPLGSVQAEHTGRASSSCVHL